MEMEHVIAWDLPIRSQGIRSSEFLQLRSESNWLEVIVQEYPDDVTAGDVYLVQFIGLIAFCSFYHDGVSPVAPFPGGTAYAIVESSAWVASLGSSVPASAKHYKISCYEESFDVVATEVRISRLDGWSSGDAA
jgi:hypothetical protein